MEKPNVCPVCRYENRAGNVYCTQCGSKLITGQTIGVRFVVLNKKKPTMKLSLNGERITIGRDPENSLVLEDSKISKHHAVVFLKNDDYWIEDVESKNGVYLNGKLIRGPQKLLDECLIKLGSTILRFERGREN